MSTRPFSLLNPGHHLNLPQQDRQVRIETSLNRIPARLALNLDQIQGNGSTDPSIFERVRCHPDSLILNCAVNDVAPRTGRAQESIPRRFWKRDARRRAAAIDPIEDG